MRGMTGLAALSAIAAACFAKTYEGSAVLLCIVVIASLYGVAGALDGLHVGGIEVFGLPGVYSALHARQAN